MRARPCHVLVERLAPRTFRSVEGSDLSRDGGILVSLSESSPSMSSSSVASLSLSTVAAAVSSCSSFSSELWSVVRRREVGVGESVGSG